MILLQKHTSMKIILFTLITAFFCVSVAAIAQIPNSGFENWTSGDPDGWATSNVPQAGLINITQTTDKHSGAYALRGEVVDFFGTPMGPVIQSGPAATGFPISEQYHSFELYYKFTSVGGDKFSVNIGLEKAGSPVAQGAVALPSTVGSYIHLTVPLTYFTADVPDLAIIQISITGPVTGSDYHLGSVMFVDDLSFSLSTGIERIPVSDLAGKCYPNPATDIISIPINESVPGEVILKIVDASGKEIKKVTSQPMQPGKNVIQLSVKELSSGLYFYSVNGQSCHYQGKFVVTR